MAATEKQFKTWQTTQSGLSRHKSIIVENLYEKKTEYGTGYAVANNRDKKQSPAKALGREMGSFGNLPNFNDNDDTPVLRATMPLSTKAIGN